MARTLGWTDKSPSHCSSRDRVRDKHGVTSIPVLIQSSWEKNHGGILSQISWKGLRPPFCKDHTLPAPGFSITSTTTEKAFSLLWKATSRGFCFVDKDRLGVDSNPLPSSIKTTTGNPPCQFQRIQHLHRNIHTLSILYTPRATLTYTAPLWDWSKSDHPSASPSHQEMDPSTPMGSNPPMGSSPSLAPQGVVPPQHNSGKFCFLPLKLRKGHQVRSEVPCRQ